MRTRPHETHRTGEHVEELRQFVERRAAQMLADRRNATVARVRLTQSARGRRRGIFRLQHTHRTEFVNDDRLATFAVATLTEEDRAG